MHEYVSICAQKAFLKQNSRNNWISLGDQNVAYFYRFVKIRNSKYTIRCLWDGGIKAEKQGQIKNLAVSLYQGLLRFSPHSFGKKEAAIIIKVMTNQNLLKCQGLLQKDD